MKGSIFSESFYNVITLYRSLKRDGYFELAAKVRRLPNEHHLAYEILEELASFCPPNGWAVQAMKQYLIDFC